MGVEVADSPREPLAVAADCDVGAAPHEQAAVAINANQRSRALMLPVDETDADLVCYE
jgi:hypothetical protein